MYEHFFLKNTKRKKQLFSLKILSGKTVKFFRCLFLSISVRQRAQTQTVRGHRSLYSSGTQVCTFFVFWCSRRLCYDMKLSEPWMKFFKFNSKIIYLWCLFLLCFFLLDFSLFLRVSKIRFVGSGRNSCHAPLTATKSSPPDISHISNSFSRYLHILFERAKL